MLKIHNISKTFNPGTVNEKKALENLNLHLEKGDFVTMDFGCKVDGYCCDMTRTVAVGYVTDEMRTVYETVLQAQLAQQGLNLEMYCSFMGTTEEKLREDAYPAAEAALRNQAAIDKIVELEGLKVASDEMAEALAVISRQNNITVEQLV